MDEITVDRIDETEDGARLAILIYPEGEVPVRVEYLPEGINAGSRLYYDFNSLLRFSQEG